MRGWSTGRLSIVIGLMLATVAALSELRTWLSLQPELERGFRYVDIPAEVGMMFFTSLVIYTVLAYLAIASRGGFFGDDSPEAPSTPG